MEWFDGYDYGYGRGYNDFGWMPGGQGIVTVISVIIGIILIFAAIGLAVRLALYILRSIGLYTIALNRGMGGAGLAWIPFIGFYRIGSIADNISARSGARSYYRYILLIGSIFSFVLSLAQNRMIYPSLLRFFNNPSGFGHFGHDYRYYMFSSVSALAVAFSIGVFVVTVIALNKIYKCYRPESSTLWTIFSVVFPFMQSVFLFVIRNAVPVPEWGPNGYYPAPNQDWQAPPYPPYSPSPEGYKPFQYEQGQSTQYIPQRQDPDASYQTPPPMDVTHQPPAPPEPPKSWGTDDALPPPPRAPWDKGSGEPS